MTTTRAPAAAPSTDLRQPHLGLTWRQVTGLAGVLATVGVATRAWVSFQGFFVIDDYVFLLQASTHRLTDPAYLLRDHFGHLMPGGHALTWLVNRAAPLSFPAFVLASSALQLWAAALAWRLLRLLFGTTPWLLVPYAVYMLSPLTLPSYVWWSAAVNALPMQIALLLAVTAYLRLLDGGGPADALRTWLATVAGLVFFEKALLIPLTLLGVGLVAAPERNPLRAAVAVVQRSWRLWLSLAATCAVYVATYRAFVDRFGARPEADQVREMLRHGFLDAVVPAIVGGPWRWVPDFLTPAAAPPTTLRWVAIATLAALVLAAVRRRTARRAWLVLFGYVLVQIGLLAAGRSMFTTIISLQYRYYADAALLVALAVGCSVVPGAGRIPAHPPAPPTAAAGAPPDPRRPSRAGVLPGVAAVAVVNLLLVGSVYSAATFADLWRTNPTRAYVVTASEALQAHPGLTVLTAPVRGDIVNGFFADREAAQLFHRLPGSASFSRSPYRLVVLDDEGHLRRGEVAGVTSEPGPETGCGWRVPAGGSTSVTLGLDVYRWYFLVALRYATDEPSTVRLSLDGPARTWHLDPRHTVRYLPVSGGGRTVRVENLGDTEVCVRSAVVGLAVPTGAPL